MAATRYSHYFTYIKPVTENKIVKSSAPYIFSLLTITVMAIFAIRPTISTILNLQKSLENNQQTLQQLNEKTRHLSEGKKNLDNLDPNIKSKIDTALPSQSNIAILIASLRNSAARESSISAIQIQPVTIYDSKSDGSSLKTANIDFSFNIQGSYQQILATLENLRKSPRLFSIDSVVITKQPGGFLSLSVTGKGFYIK